MINEVWEQHSEEMKFVLTEEGRPTGTHSRTYNLPVADEVALVRLDENLSPGDVQIYLRGGGVRRISNMNRKSDCLHYTSLFPQGQDTWHKDLKKVNQAGNERRISSAEYYRHLIQVFANGFNGILRSGKLFQEFICISSLFPRSCSYF